MQEQRDRGYDFIRFFAMSMIVIHHIFTTWKEQHYHIPEFIANIVGRGAIGFGGVGVALFFMLSGALLIKKYETGLKASEFYKKRLWRIEIPQMIGFFCAFWCQYLVTPHIINHKPESLFFSFIGLGYSGEFWAQFGRRNVWVIGEWFTAVIIILYILFPALRWLFVNHKNTGGCIIALLFLINLKYQILTYHRGWFSITNGLMCFWMGMLFEKYKYILCRRPAIGACAAFVILYWIVNPQQILGYSYLSCFIFSLPLFVVLYQITFSNRFIRFVSKYNYEIYLVHHRVFILLFPALLTAKSNAWQLGIAAVLLTGITLLLSESLHRATEWGQNKIYRLLHIKETC